MSSKGKYDRTISMLCPTCGRTQFEYDGADPSGEVTCTVCGLKLQKDDLINANGKNISGHVDQIKKEAVKDVVDQLRRAFKGSKGIRFK